MNLCISMASHRGKVRQKNEDNFYVDGLNMPQHNNGISPRTLILNDDRPHLFGVFDGMGGYAAGERASRLAAEAAQELCGTQLHRVGAQELLLQICKLANERVCNAMMSSAQERIGTTASMLHFEQNRFTVCNVGDSPIFLFRSGKLLQLHEEHTERANYERISGAPAPPNKKFRLTQNIGIFMDEMLIEPYCAADIAHEGDQFLICSDGLTDMVSVQTICDVLSGTQTAQEKVETLLNMALENGGKDNITVVLVYAQPIQKQKQGFPSLAVWISTLALLTISVACIFLLLGSLCKPTLPESTEPPKVTASIESNESTEAEQAATDATEVTDFTESNGPTEATTGTAATEATDAKKPNEPTEATQTTDTSEVTEFTEPTGIAGL